LTENKRYTGSVYVGIVGPERDYSTARDSIQKLLLRPGDSGPHFSRATKGYEARQTHLNNFIESTHDFIFFGDHDQVFPADTIEKLRNHQLPYVSGLYLRRSYQPIAPIWFRPFTGEFPFEPWVGKIERGRLHEIGASGWGCVLIHRDVVMAVRDQLKGEWEIFEDFMDIYPYDLKRIMSAVHGLRKLVDKVRDVNIEKIDQYLTVLEEEIRPLRADKTEPVGSDIRFPFFALQAGYQLYGDPDVRCGHMLDYPLSPDDFDGLPSETLEKIAASLDERMKTGRAQIKKQRNEVLSA